VNRDVPRLYVEAKSFLKLRSQRNKMVKDARRHQADPPLRSARARRQTGIRTIEGGAQIESALFFLHLK